MKILHLSDLHVTSSDETLNTVWTAVPSALRGCQFDAIIVSGDLTQQADRAEYEALHRFTEKHLLPLLKDKARDNRRRIVFVPGNHDVSWPLAKLAYEPVSKPIETKVLEEYRENPDRSKIRLRFNDDGSVTWMRRNFDNAYAARFLEVQRFLTKFYPSLPDKDRQFDLLALGGEGDWSAHVFEQEKVAIYGFNSCHANDSYWHGAHIANIAIEAARAHADEKLGKDFLRVAVWHHGLDGERERPDRLLLAELGRLRAAGFRVGFHGHVHRSLFEAELLTDDRFVLVSAGSLGAASKDRPGAVGNQFSIAKLRHTSVFVETFSLDERDHTYKQDKDKRRRAYLIRESEESSRISTAERVVRTIEMDDQGIADISITLENVETQGPIILANPAGSLGTVCADERAEVDNQSVPVKERERGGYELPSSSATYQKVTWNYRVANALAMRGSETAMFPRRPYLELPLPDGHEVWLHEVSIDTDELHLVLKYPKSLESFYEEDPLVMVQRPVRNSEDGADWERVPAEQLRCQSGLEKAEDEITLKITAPVRSYRYGIQYKLRDRGTRFSDDMINLLKDLLQQFRYTKRNDQRRAALTEELMAVVRLHAGCSEDFEEDSLTVKVSLWDPEQRLLLPVAGSFRPSLWAFEFPFGVGVAGHCFRFGTIAAWYKGKRDRTSIIRMPSPPGQRDHDWILLFPLFGCSASESELPPVMGVIGVAGEDRPPWGRLQDMARMTGRDEIKQKCANMALHLHEVFWKSLAGLVESEVLNETIEKRGEIWKSAVLSWGVATDSDSKGSPK